MLDLRLKKYFWDTDFESLNAAAHKKYIIERILELGDEAAVQWLFQNFSRAEVAEILKHSRRISDKSGNFWRLLLTN